MFTTELAEVREIAGLKFELSIGGEGTPVLFLHAGHGVDEKDPLVERLARKHKVYVVSHPGFGRSELPDDYSTVDDLAYAYLDLIEELDLRDLTLVGVSFGAWIAAEIATKGSERVSRLVLIDAVGVKLSDRETRDLLDVYGTTVEDMPGIFFKDEEKGRAALANLDFRSLDENLVTRFVRNRESFLRFGWSPLLYNPKLAGRLHRVKQPVLMLWGSEDKVAPVDYGRRYAAKFPDAQFEVIENAGHYGYLEQPAAFADKVETFLAT
jgi:pimeloyl-ACP methyl ester carboxylesterase